jgi:redox-sensitive bicupin YhaK (pirin superfamily)
MKRAHGLISRMFSPGDFGPILKPFVFLDYVSGDVGAGGLTFGFHPHSGIATLTYPVHADID